MAQVSTPDTETEEGKADVSVVAAVGDGPGSSIPQHRNTSSVNPGSRGRRVDTGGVIDLDKLMHSIDMTRKVALLQQRLTQASLLAQSQASPSSTGPSAPIAPEPAPLSSNLRKRKSMASLSIVAPRELEHTDRPNPTSAHLFSPSRPSSFRSPGQGPGSPNTTIGFRSPSASTAAGIQVLNSIASRRRESGAATGPQSPRNGPASASSSGGGPRVAFAYPRSPSNGTGQGPVVRSPGRGRYISSSGSVRFETSGFSDLGTGGAEGEGMGVEEEEEEDGSGLTSPRKRPRAGATRTTLQRKPSVTLMPAFGSNTIYGIQRDPEESTAMTTTMSPGRLSRKPRSASHSVESRPFIARNILTGYQRVEESPLSSSQDDPGRNLSSRETLRMPFGTDASDVDAANGLMSMLGSAPASFNPSRNAGPYADVRSPTLEAPGHHLRAPKPRAASFAAILTTTGGFARPHHRIASPTRVRRFQQDRTGQPSPSGVKRRTLAGTSDEHVSACATSSSSDEENLKASAAASASDEDQQAAEAILFLAASPSPAITHSSPAKPSLHRVTASANTKIGRVLFDEDETDSARRLPVRAKGYPSLPSMIVAQQKRPAVGDSPLQQPPINNTSPSRDRFSKVLPLTLTTAAPSISLTLDAEQDTPAMPLTAPLDPGMDETGGGTLPEPTELLSPPDSDHSKP